MIQSPHSIHTFSKILLKYSKRRQAAWEGNGKAAQSLKLPEGYDVVLNMDLQKDRKTAAKIKSTNRFCSIKNINAVFSGQPYRRDPVSLFL